MAYVRPLVRVRENNRRIIRGGIWDAPAGRSTFQATSDEALKIDVDFTDVLNSATITAAVTSDGVTASAAVSSGVVTLTISAATVPGDIDLTVTFDDGRISQEFLRVHDPSYYNRDDYGLVAVS